jgi:hypothetical protein
MGQQHRRAVPLITPVGPHPTHCGHSPGLMQLRCRRFRLRWNSATGCVLIWVFRRPSLLAGAGHHRPIGSRGRQPDLRLAFLIDLRRTPVLYPQNKAREPPNGGFASSMAGRQGLIPVNSACATLGEQDEHAKNSQLLQPVHRTLWVYCHGGRWPVHSAGPRSIPSHRASAMRQGPRGAGTGL